VRVGGTAEGHAARADKWLDAYQIAVTYLEPEKMRAAYEWAVGMGSTDIPKSMSEWLLDGLVASRASQGADT
jgi:hypothetical protein